MGHHHRVTRFGSPRLSRCQYCRSVYDAGPSLDGRKSCPSCRGWKEKRRRAVLEARVARLPDHVRVVDCRGGCGAVLQACDARGSRKQRFLPPPATVGGWPYCRRCAPVAAQLERRD